MVKRIWLLGIATYNCTTYCAYQPEAIQPKQRNYLFELMTQLEHRDIANKIMEYIICQELYEKIKDACQPSVNKPYVDKNATISFVEESEGMFRASLLKKPAKGFCEYSFYRQCTAPGKSHHMKLFHLPANVESQHNLVRLVFLKVAIQIQDIKSECIDPHLYSASQNQRKIAVIQAIKNNHDMILKQKGFTIIDIKSGDVSVYKFIDEFKKEADKGHGYYKLIEIANNGFNLALADSTTIYLFDLRKEGNAGVKKIFTLSDHNKSKIVALRFHDSCLGLAARLSESGTNPDTIKNFLLTNNEGEEISMPTFFNYCKSKRVIKERLETNE
jgi:hypothetical protein